MLAFRSRQYSYENALARWILILCLALLVGLFTVSGAWAEALWVCVATIAVLAACLMIPLTVSVDDDSVQVSLAGVLRREIPLTDISTVERVDYRPIGEFGGWGWRFGLAERNARAYTTRGDTAVRLTLNAHGERVYLGVDDEAALEAALNSRIGSASR